MNEDYIVISHLKVNKHSIYMQAINIVILHRKVNKYFIEIQAIKKKVRSNIYKLALHILDFFLNI